MLKNILRKSLIIIICQTLVYSPLIRATEPLPLPSGDQTEPEISQKNYIKTVKKGADVQITVTVTDNDVVKQVTLKYKTISSTNNYKRKTMDKIGDTDDYRATIKSDKIKAPGVEYFVEAIDNAGNKSSAPLIRVSQLTLPPRDRIKPVITQDKYEETIRPGTSHEVEVKVTDNVEVKLVTMFYRTISKGEYKRRPMQKVGTSDFYVAKINADEIVSPGIEYYIQAMDVAGNTLLHGHSFSPLSVKLDTTNILAAESNKDSLIKTESDDDKGISKWVWIGLGAVLVGAVASSSSSSGGGGDEPATTGTVTITEPTP